MSDVKIKRREFVKRAAYAAPMILTLKAMPAFAAAGSGNIPRGVAAVLKAVLLTRTSKEPTGLIVRAIDMPGHLT